ncbi:MAG: hypothetical protein PGMFKBFP_02526 [Anaerolineales bacterium]|nr:hypothetical protein [Anaerolineales bacterium]
MDAVGGESGDGGVERVGETFHIFGHDEGVAHLDDFVAGVGERFARDGIAAEEVTIARALVVDQQRGVEVGHPLAEDVVGAGAVFFDVVVDEVTIGTREMVAYHRLRPEEVGENLELEGEVEQVVFETVLAKQCGAGLRVGVDAAPGGVARPRGGETVGDLAVVEADDGGFVQVIYDLRVESVAVNGNGLKEAFVQFGADEARHVVLRGFEGEEDGRLVGIFESRAVGDERPEEFAHAAGESAEGGEGDLSTGEARGEDGLLVGRLQSPLGSENQHGLGGQARGQETKRALHSCGRLARARASTQEDLRVEGKVGDGALGGGEVEGHFKCLAKNFFTCSQASRAASGL